jgi:hypothetical protein
MSNKTTLLKGNQSFKVYIDKLGNQIAINTELQLGKPFKENYGKFQTWFVRDLFSVTPIDKLMSGSKVKVKKIFIFKSGFGNNSIFIVNMDCEQIDKSLSKSLFVVGAFDKSLENGETIFETKAMNKDKALKILKDKKELLDLEIIKQSEYDSLKRLLTPIILKN